MKCSNRRVSVVLALLSVSTAYAQFGGPAMEQKITDAKPGDVRVLATAAILGPLEAIRAQAQKEIGKPIVIEYGSARGNLKTMLQAGQACEVSLLLPDVNQELVAQHKLDSKQYKIASVPVALAIKGTPSKKLDVSTKEGIKAAFVNASVVRYATTGAARPTVDKILDTLNIRSAIKDGGLQSGPQQGGAGEAPLAAGLYEMHVFPLSEILISKGLTNLGPVIPELQVPSIIEASVCGSPADRASAQALIKFLQGSAIEPALKVSGMTR